MANIRFTKSQLEARYIHIAKGNTYYHRNGTEYKLPNYNEMLWKPFIINNKEVMISNCMVVLNDLSSKEIPKIYFNSDKPVLKSSNNEMSLSDVVDKLFKENSRVREFRLNEFNHLRI